MSSFLVLIEFRDCRYSQPCWYFDPAFVNYFPLPSLQFTSRPLPCVSKSRSIQSIQYTVCNRGVRDRVVLRAYTVLELYTVYCTHL